MIDKILNTIRDERVTIREWMLGFTGIYFVRFIFEALSSPTSSGIIPSDIDTFINYELFFLSIVLGTACIVGYLTRDNKTSVKIALFTLPIIWIAPIIDIILSAGKGYKMSYIFDSHTKLLVDFFTFFGPNLTHGSTYGMRIEIALILIGVVWYIWRTTKNIFRTVIGALLVYVLGFIMGALPGFIYTLSHIHAPVGTLPEVLNYLAKITSESNVAHNTLREGALSVPFARFIELGFDKILSQILFIFSCIFGTLVLWGIDPKKFLAVVKNLRLERVGSYIALLFCGMGFAYIHNLANPFIWVDVLGIICLIISWVGLWMYAVHTNDITDTKIDAISNTNRPLIQKTLDEKSMRDVGYVWLAVALLGSWAAGFYPFFMSLVYIAVSYIYSAPPLRLRRFPIIPSFLIGIASLSTILAGFFFISANKETENFPIFLAVGIVIMTTLAINIKDMKDVEGDKAGGIITLPILFGKNGSMVVGLCFALSFLLVPIFLSTYFLYIFAIPCAIIGYRLVVKKPYKEKPTFILRFIFLGLVAVSYIGVYWFGHVYNLL